MNIQVPIPDLSSKKRTRTGAIRRIRGHQREYRISPQILHNRTGISWQVGVFSCGFPLTKSTTNEVGKMLGIAERLSAKPYCRLLGTYRRIARLSPGRPSVASWSAFCRIRIQARVKMLAVVHGSATAASKWSRRKEWEETLSCGLKI